MFGKRKRLKFLEENKVSQQYHKYLCLGAVLVDMNDCTSFVLNIRIDPKSYAKVIDRAWGISGKEDLMETIKYLTEGGGHRVRGDEILASIRGGLSSANYEETVSNGEYYKIEKSYFDSCRTTSAWDIERVAFLTRVCHHLGYITEEENWEILMHTAVPFLNDCNFNSWKDYAASLVLGRSLCYGGNSSEVLFPIKELLYQKKEPSVWQNYSITDLKA